MSPTAEIERAESSMVSMRPRNVVIAFFLLLLVIGIIMQTQGLPGAPLIAFPVVILGAMAFLVYRGKL